jgi:hypothetical protein
MRTVAAEPDRISPFGVAAHEMVNRTAKVDVLVHSATAITAAVIISGVVCHDYLQCEEW